MPKTINVGVITHPQGAHLSLYFSALADTPEVGGVALADPTGKTAAEAKAALGDKLRGTYTDTGEMLGKFRPQMALVSMEAALAPPAIDAALDAGCHVMAEKPACVRAEDFAPLVRKADSKHLHLMLAFANRLLAPVQEARRLMREGMLGKFYGLQMHLVADQTRITHEAYRKSWFASKARAGGGHLIWLGIHWLDLAMYITGQTVEQVTGLTAVAGGQPIDVEDSAAVAMRFSEGALGTMTSGYYLDKGYHSHLYIWGEQGWLRLHAIDQQPLEWYSTKDAGGGQIQRFVYPQSNRDYHALVRACVLASADLEPPPVTGAECLQVLKTIFAFYEAAATGKVQSVT